MPLNILLLVDDPLVGASLEQMVTSDRRFILEGSFPLTSFVDLDTSLTGVDALLVDLGWNGTSAREALSSLVTHPRILVLHPPGMSGTDPILARYAGAALRTIQGTKILSALEAVALGFRIREPDRNGSLVPGEEIQSYMTPLEPLTARENEVLACLMEGLPNKMIAVRLGISEHTAKFHVTSILSKLGVQSRTEAVIRAARMGLIHM